MTRRNGHTRGRTPGRRGASRWLPHRSRGGTVVRTDRTARRLARGRVVVHAPLRVPPVSGTARSLVPFACCRDAYAGARLRRQSRADYPTRCATRTLGPVMALPIPVIPPQPDAFHLAPHRIRRCTFRRLINVESTRTGSTTWNACSPTGRSRSPSATSRPRRRSATPASRHISSGPTRTDPVGRALEAPATRRERSATHRRSAVRGRGMCRPAGSPSLGRRAPRGDLLEAMRYLHRRQSPPGPPRSRPVHIPARETPVGWRH